MGNMAYCRFVNTLEDLRDCYDHLDDDLSETEEQAKKRLLRLCAEIVSYNEGFDKFEEDEGDA